MSIASASVLKDGTVATTAGTATAINSEGSEVGNHETTLNDSEPFVTRTEVLFTSKKPKVSATAPNGYTQARRTVKLKQHFVLDNGNSTVNTITIEQSCDMELTDAELLTLRVYGAQLLHDSDFTEFWNDGATA